MLVRLALGFFAVGTLLLAMTACPVTNQMGPDGGDGDALGDDGGNTVNPPLRDLTFGDLPPGDFAGGTFNGITIQTGAFMGGQIIQIQNQLGEGQDLILECGQLLITAPELHKEFSVVFNDDNATLYIAVLDQNGQMFNSRAYDTHLDANQPFITRVDPIYKKLDVSIAPGSNALIGSIGIASCQGFLHEVVLH